MVAGPRAGSPALHPYRFGGQLHSAPSGRDWQELARRAEGLGYDVLVVPDHLDGAFAWGAALASAAAATTRLRLGTFVLQAPLRHPALVAAEAATVDLLADGRFELGIGAGGSELDDYERTGIRFDPPGTRAGQLEESVRVVRAMLAGEPLNFAGRHYRFSGFDGVPRPVQRPVPLLIGAGGPRLLRLAAREADIVSILPPMLPQGGAPRLNAMTIDAYRRQLGVVRAAAGERLKRLELNSLVQRLVLTDRPDAEAGAIAARWPIPADEVLASPYVLHGSVDAIAETIARRRAELGISYYVVFDRDLDAFAPVVARLAGR